MLFVSPIMPDVTGSGLAMRAGAIIDILARRADVSLLVVPLHGVPTFAVPPAIAACCRRVAVMRPPDCTPGDAALLRALRVRWPAAAETVELPAEWPFGHRRFDVVHVYRLTALPYALPYLFPPERPPARHLDFDEAESATRRRQAAWCRTASRLTQARFADLEAACCEALERDVLRRFDRVYVCSASERDALPGVTGAAVPVVVPNTVTLPARPRARIDAGPFRLLFVGTLGYPANADAVTFLCEEIAPRLRRTAGAEIDVVVVGSGASERMSRLGRDHGVRFAGGVPDVAPWYRDADAVAVPVRLGGGTRLKVLEAMSYGRPVVTTSLGVRGLDVRSGRDVVIADSAEQFAAACRRLIDDRRLARSVGQQARRFVRSHHLRAAAAAALVG